MESITFEICCATGDPLDRTLGVLCRSGQQLLAARAYRVSPDIRLGEVLTWIDRITLEWALPRMDEQESFYDVLDRAAEALTAPF